MDIRNRYGDYYNSSLLSIEEAEQIPEDMHVVIAHNEYTPDQYLRMKRVIDSVVPPNSDSMDDVSKFSHIFTKLAQFDIDRSDAAEDDWTVSLENNKCGRLGYAILLREALISSGVESMEVRGFFKENQNFKRNWTQVKINDKWYNCDLATARENVDVLKNPRQSLVSDGRLYLDKTLENYERDTNYPCEVCKESYEHNSLKERSVNFLGNAVAKFKVTLEKVNKAGKELLSKIKDKIVEINDKAKQQDNKPDKDGITPVKRGPNSNDIELEEH